MSIKKTICLSFALFMLSVFLAPNIVLAINHEYVGCVKDKIDKTTGNCETDGERKVCYEGIVPCGKSVLVGKTKNSDVYWDDGNKICKATLPFPDDGAQVVVNCQLCHFFVIIDSIMDFILFNIVPPLTIAVLVIGGVLFYFAGAKPELRNKSITLFKDVLIGLVLIYGAYMLVGIFLMILGAADMNPLKSVFDSSKGIFSITCPLEVP